MFYPSNWFMNVIFLCCLFFTYKLRCQTKEGFSLHEGRTSLFRSDHRSERLAVKSENNNEQNIGYIRLRRDIGVVIHQVWRGPY